MKYLKGIQDDIVKKWLKQIVKQYGADNKWVQQQIARSKREALAELSSLKNTIADDVPWPPRYMCPGAYLKPVYLGERRHGVCMHCKQVSISYCPYCKQWVCNRRFTHGDQGCANIHGDSCKGGQDGTERLLPESRGV